jgi:soluble P-type ATPase
MIDIVIPGHGHLQLDHLVLDYNGTLACDGRLIPHVQPALNFLAERIQIHVLTADTQGGAAEHLTGIACRMLVLGPGAQDVAKRDYLRRLGVQRCAAVGNGRNDRLMLAEAALGIAVIGPEGAASDALHAAHITCTSIASALALLAVPLRLIATLRC